MRFRPHSPCALALRAVTWIAIACLPVLALAACAEVVGSRDEPQDQIIFLSDRNVAAEGWPQLTDIYRMNADGTGVRNLTGQPARHSGLSLSPDGRKLAFSRWGPDGEHVLVMNTDGSGLTRLTTEAGGDSPRWSPDGTRIAFRRHGAIYVMDADGGNPRDVSSAAQGTGCGSSPTPRIGLIGWTPGGQLVFYHYYCGVGARYFIVQADGSGPAPLGFDIREGYWSPDGSRIALVNNANSRLSVMNTDGSGLRALTSPDGQDRLEFRSVAEYSPWSPDGRRIVFQHIARVDTSWTYALHVVGVDGSGARELMRPLPGSFNGWSPRGDRMAFTGWDGEFTEVYVANADGTGLVNLTRSPSHDRDAIWVPR